MRIRWLLLSLMVVTGLTVGLSRTAGAVTWVFCLNPGDCVGGTGGTIGHEASFTADGLALKARAYYADSNGTDPFVDATLGRYAKGLGVTSPGTDSNDLDNANAREEFILFELPGLFDLRTLVLSHVHPNDDASVWVGTGPAGLDLGDGTRSVGGLTAGGFTFTQVFAGDIPPAGGAPGTILHDQAVGLSGTGRYLLVSGIVGADNDEFKIRALSADPYVAPVAAHAPEPATLLLLGSGLVAARLVVRRRRPR